MLDTRQQILQATEVVLATHGFQGLSMHKVAREAGIATGTIYCHFKDKEDLLVQLCNTIRDQIAEKICANVATSGSLYARYRQLWLNIWNFCNQYPDQINNQQQYDNVPGFSQPAWEEQLQRYAVWFALLEEGIASQQILDLPRQVLSTLSLETAYSLFKRLHATGIELDDVMLERTIQASWRSICQTAADNE